jgi:HEAT repeat protein
MNPIPALLAAVLLAAPAAPVPSPSDAEVRAHAEALLGAIDRPVPAARWKALGPVAVDVLAEVAASPDRMPSRRSQALAALAEVDAARAVPIARAIADADGAPPSTRETAVRVLGRTLPPAALRSAVAPLLRAAPDANLRAVAAETLARHAPGLSCAEVMDQVSLEPAGGRAAFERAARLCDGR